MIRQRRASKWEWEISYAGARQWRPTFCQWVTPSKQSFQGPITGLGGGVGKVGKQGEAAVECANVDSAVHVIPIKRRALRKLTPKVFACSRRDVGVESLPSVSWIECEVCTQKAS